jgi:replicative DNA helicase
MACTLRLAVRSAKLGQPEVNLGLMPGFAGTQRLPRLVGRGRALELLLTGDPIGAEDAERWGLVNRVVESHEELLPAARELATRMLGSIARVDQHKMRTGRLNDQEWSDLSEAMGRLHDAPLYIDETAALNALELRSRARRLWRLFGGKLGLVVVDYLQLMSSSNPRAGENRATEISEISRSLKALAKELNVPVVALSQLSRAVESRNDKRPMMSDLSESGAIEQDADVILFIYRDEVYFPEKPEAKGRAEVIIGKQRNGPIGKVMLTFLNQYIGDRSHFRIKS